MSGAECRFNREAIFHLPSVPRPFPEQVADWAGRLVEDRVPALAGLFDLTSARLVRYALALVRSQHDAEDAVQASLARLAAQPHPFAAAQHPWPYLLRMVRNEALQIVRRNRRTSVTNQLGPLEFRRSVDDMESAETRHAVWTSLQRLPAEQAEVVALKIWEGLTFAEIGQVLGKSPNTVASRYQYALRRLSQYLGSVQAELLR
ncbi:MAG TPA: sigma-70 family RNA polymerase sigma factor [Pirellulaceae bacterium]